MHYLRVLGRQTHHAANAVNNRNRRKPPNDILRIAVRYRVAGRSVVGLLVITVSIDASQSIGVGRQQF